MKKNSELILSLAQIIYTLIPFALLIIIKIYKNEGAQIFMSADWGIAASLLFGQAQSKIISAGLSSKNSSESGYQLYNSLRILFLIVALCTFTLMSINPNYTLAIFQFLLFFFSIFIFIKDSVASQIIKNNTK